MTVYDSLGREFRFTGVAPTFLPAGGLELRYTADPEKGLLAAYFPPGGWVAIRDHDPRVEPPQ